MHEYQDRQANSISGAVSLLTSQKKYQTPRIAKRLEELVEIDRRIFDLRQAQGLSSYTRGTTTLKWLREELRVHHINPLSADGKVLLDGQPGIADSLRPPAAKASDAKLIEAARRIIDNVRPFKDTFLREGYHPDFLERAGQAVDNLERVGRETPQDVIKRSRATRELPGVIKRGRTIMAGIDRLVASEFANDSTAVSVWKQVYRVPRTIGRPKAKRARRPKGPPEA